MGEDVASVSSTTSTKLTSSTTAGSSQAPTLIISGSGRGKRNNNNRSNDMSGADWRHLLRDFTSEVFDLMGDWAYLYAICHRDYDGDGNGDSDPTAATPVLGLQFDYLAITRVTLGFCILSSVLFTWTMITSLGRGCLKWNSVCCNCTVSRISLMSIILEDLPQFCLVFYIDYSYAGGLTPSGVMNICSSVPAFVNRATRKIDEIEAEEDTMDGDVIDAYKNYNAMP
ncbi:hypothetical protein ACHAWU_010402 [Discostella pseudostelligera]|uniref:Uncharacterized protein n=1 Tax=Discostella pseudostelligera TaxID=259834 RepID=A0ABD3MMD3_9STRA